jgi:hypothetical protein
MLQQFMNISKKFMAKNCSSVLLNVFRPTLKKGKKALFAAFFGTKMTLFELLGIFRNYFHYQTPPKHHLGCNGPPGRLRMLMSQGFMIHDLLTRVTCQHPFTAELQFQKIFSFSLLIIASDIEVLTPR